MKLDLNFGPIGLPERSHDSSELLVGVAQRRKLVELSAGIIMRVAPLANPRAIAQVEAGYAAAEQHRQDVTPHVAETAGTAAVTAAKTAPAEEPSVSLPKEPLATNTEAYLTHMDATEAPASSANVTDMEAYRLQREARIAAAQQATREAQTGPAVTPDTPNYSGELADAA